MNLRRLAIGLVFACGSSPAQVPHHFPSPPAIADANPAVRHPVQVKVPTRLTAHRRGPRVEVGLSPDSLEEVTITVGDKMVTGVRTLMRIYPAGQIPATALDASTTSGVALSGMGDFTGMTNYLTLPAANSIVEMKVEIFETDIPPQHMWMPGSPKFRVVWQRTLTRTVP